MLKQKMKEAVELRKEGNAEAALELLLSLLPGNPGDPDLNYQLAWTCDSLGREKEAAPFYESALANGLQEDRCGAFLGLGSTYRCLGEYEKSIAIFDRALLEFPDARSLRVFRAMTLFNLDRAEESVRELLLQLLETTSSKEIQSYEKALRFYSERLREKWT